MNRFSCQFDSPVSLLHGGLLKWIWVTWTENIRSKKKLTAGKWRFMYVVSASVILPLDRYRVVSSYDCLAMYQFSQNRRIMILSLSWTMYHILYRELSFSWECKVILQKSIVSYFCHLKHFWSTISLSKETWLSWQLKKLQTISNKRNTEQGKYTVKYKYIITVILWCKSS